jgi:UDP-N-acetylmuramate: L-alanyl-gamma-D-glutamyl-meso-diaminopimelate ligase
MLHAVRERYPDHYLIACFELHTYSSLSQTFLSEYRYAMDNCDAGAVFFSAHAIRLKGLNPLDTDTVKEYFDNPTLQVFDEKEQLRQWILDEKNKSSHPVCLLLMSSGTYDGMNLQF